MDCTFYSIHLFVLTPPLFSFSFVPFDNTGRCTHHYMTYIATDSKFSTFLYTQQMFKRVLNIFSIHLSKMLWNQVQSNNNALHYVINEIKIFSNHKIDIFNLKYQFLIYYFGLKFIPTNTAVISVMINLPSCFRFTI